MSEPLDLRTRENHWIVKHQDREITNNPYDAWLRHRTVTSDGRTIPDQAVFFAGWHALHDWLTHGLGFEGRLSEYDRRAAAQAAPADRQGEG